MRRLPLTAAEDLLEIIMRRYERASNCSLPDNRHRWFRGLDPSAPSLRAAIITLVFRVSVPVSHSSETLYNSAKRTNSPTLTSAGLSSPARGRVKDRWHWLHCASEPDISFDSATHRDSS